MNKKDMHKKHIRLDLNGAAQLLAQLLVVAIEEKITKKRLTSRKHAKENH